MAKKQNRTISRTHGIATQKEHLRTLARQMNNSLNALEKTAYTSTSQFYREYRADVEHGGSPWLKVNRSGKLVYRSDVDKFTPEMVREYREFLENRLSFKSRKVSEEKKTEKKFEEKFGLGSYTGAASDAIKRVIGELVNQFGSKEGEKIFDTALQKFKNPYLTAMYIKDLLTKYAASSPMSTMVFYEDIKALDENDLFISDEVDLGW